MKKLILLLFVLVGCSSSDATFMLTSQTAAPTACATAGCDGTYMFCWTGDYTADSDKACFTSGSATKDGTQTGTVEIDAAYGRSGNGIRINAIDESWGWAVSGNDGIDDAVGTAWFSIYTPELSSEINFFEVYSDSNDDGIEIALGATADPRAGRPNAGYRANDTTDEIDGVISTGTLDPTTWTRVMYSWDQANDKHKICADRDNGGDKDAGECQEATADGLGVWGVDPSKILIGELYFGTAPAEYVWVDEVKVLSTYDAADPNPF